MKTYKHAFAAGEKKVFDYSSARFFMLLETSSPVDVEIYFSEGAGVVKGELAEAVEGGFKVSAPHGVVISRIEVTSSVAQTVKLGVSSLEMDNVRVSGAVQVIDGSKNIVLEKRAFSFVKVWTALAANYNHVQLWNPAGSGKRAYVNKIAVADTTGVGSFGVLRYATKLSTQYTDVPNKNLGEAAASDIEVWVEQKTSLVGTELLINLRTPQNETKIIDLSEPIMVPPGQGLLIRSGQVNAESYMSMQFYIEDE